MKIALYKQYEPNPITFITMDTIPRVGETITIPIGEWDNNIRLTQVWIVRRVDYYFEDRKKTPRVILEVENPL